MLPRSILQHWSKVTVFEEIIQWVFLYIWIFPPYELLLLSALLSNPPPKMNPLVAMHCDQHTAIYKYKTEALPHMKNEPSWYKNSSWKVEKDKHNLRNNLKLKSYHILHSNILGKNISIYNHAFYFLLYISCKLMLFIFKISFFNILSVPPQP